MLEKIFIKDYKNYKDATVRASYGKLCGIVGIITNLLLCAVKMISGFLIGSIAIVADGINNLADAGSSIITLIGFKLSSMPADEDHPFGHQRYEYIAGLLVSLIILVIGILLMKSSIEKLIAFEVQVYDTLTCYVTIGLLIFAICMKFFQSYFYKKNGKLINSKTLIASSVDSLNDCISTSVVLVSIIINLFYANAFIDGVMGIIVSVFIIISGVKLIKETISPLIGEAPTKEFVEEVANKLLKYDGVLGIHDMQIHTYGPEKIFITVHVEVDSEADINESHDMIDNIEQDFIKGNLNLVIHMDPIETKNEVTNALKEKIKNILFNIDPVLTFHDFRVVKGNTHTNMIFDIVVPTKYKFTNDHIKDLLNEEIKKEKEVYNLVVRFDETYVGNHHFK